MVDITAILLSLGYVGAFVSGFFSTFTLFLPSPTFIVVFLLAGAGLNPLLLGVLGGLGATIGETIGYGVGYGIGMGAKKYKKSRWLKQRKYVERLFEKHHPNLVIFVFSALPIIPFDLVGIFCGAIKYNYKHFIFYLALGKVIKYIVLAYAGFYGVDFMLKLF